MRVDLLQIFEEYDRAVAYNSGIGLYDTVRQNENFFIGRQWEGDVYKRQDGARPAGRQGSFCRPPGRRGADRGGNPAFFR